MATTDEGTANVSERWLMRTGGDAPFNDLPAQVRAQFVAAAANRDARTGPIAFERVRLAPHAGKAIVAGGIVLFVAVSAAVGVVEDHSFAVGVEYLPWLLLAMLAIAFGVAGWWYRRGHARALPYRPGRYLFRSAFVDASSSMLRMRPFTVLQHVSREVKTNGRNFAWMDLQLQFAGGTETIRISDRNVAQATLDALAASAQQEADAIAARNLQGLVTSFDPFFDIGSAAPQSAAAAPAARPLPAPWSAAKWKPAGAGALGAAALWSALVVYADDTAFRHATFVKTEHAYRWYLSEGRFHVAEARAGLPAAALADARRTRTVTAYRHVVAAYPQSPEAVEARGQIHQVFVRSFDAFKQRAKDAAVVAFFERLVTYLERHDSPNIEVRFSAPSSEELKQADVRLVARDPRVRPIAGHFGPDTAAAKMQTIFNQLQSGFAMIFPGDVLKLALLKGNAQPTAVSPAMTIAYTVRPSGSFYELVRSSEVIVNPATKPAYTGIRVSFDVALGIPQEANPLTLAFEVRPPAEFDVKGGTPGTGLSDAIIYGTMADRSFDELSRKLRDLFFGSTAAPATEARATAARAR